MKRRDFLQRCTVGVSVAAGCWAGVSMATEIEPQRNPGIDADRLKQRVLEHFLTEDLTCCESILLTGCEALGIESDVVPDIALGLAGGIGLQGGTCGVLTSSAMVLSVAIGGRETDYAMKKMRTLQAVSKVYSEFRNEFGCTDCRSLCGLDLTTPEGRKRLTEGVKVEKCTKFVSAAAELLARELQTIEKGTES